MSTPCACGTAVEDEKFTAVTSWHCSTEKESPSEKNLKLEAEDIKGDLKVEDDAEADLKVDHETGSVLKAKDEAGADLKVEHETGGSVLKAKDEAGSDLKVEHEIGGSVLKAKDEAGADLKVENETGGSVLKDKDETGADLKVDDEGKVEYDPDDWETWPNKDVFIKYYQQLRESDGFDFDEYPGSCLFAPIYPILGFERHPEFVDRIKGYASMAIKKYFRKRNHKKERYVKEIVKINGGGPRDFNFYITFKIDNEGKEETFQARVVSTIEDTIEIPICRRKKI